MVSIKLMAIMAIIGYLAFVFIAESYNPFHISPHKRKRTMHAIGVTTALIIASSPLVLKIWPASTLREQISLILLVLLAALSCLIVLHGLYYLFSRFFRKSAASTHTAHKNTANLPGANLLTNTAGAHTALTGGPHEADATVVNRPPIEINADRMFDANLEAALDSAEADFKSAKTDTNEPKYKAISATSVVTTTQPEASAFVEDSSDISEAEWSDSALESSPTAMAQDAIEPITSRVDSESMATTSRHHDDTHLQTTEFHAREGASDTEINASAPASSTTTPLSEANSPAESKVTLADDDTEYADDPSTETEPYGTDISTAIVGIKSKTAQLRSTIERVSDQLVIGEQRFAELGRKQQEQLISQRREINRQASLVQDLKSTEQKQSTELSRIDRLQSATETLVTTQREQLEEARRFRRQADRLLAAREEALIAREHALRVQEQELTKSRLIAKKAALAARKAALAHQQTHVSMLREKLARNRTEQRAQKAVSIAKNAISRLASEEAKNQVTR